MFTIIGAIIGGLVIGLLGKWVAPDHVRVPLWLTVACGIGGIFVGGTVYLAIFGHNAGIEWWKHVWQVATAAVLVTAASNSRARRSLRPRSGGYVSRTGG
jgi:uncharacterized membrane protein YeaQ/YmgE (transglycosylase-associated protein family)